MEDTLPESPFKNFKLHDTWFDWTDKKLDAKSIGKKLMGSVSYWDDPIYGEVRNKDGEILQEAMQPHEIEKEILFEAGREQWAYESVHGKKYYQHFLTLMALLDENTDITPTIADATQMFCMSFSHGIKALNLIGSQNAGKSAGSVRIAFCCFYIDPEFTSIYVLNPYTNTSESTVWGDILEMWDNICLTHPHEDGEKKTALFPKGFVYQDRYITAIPKLAKAGFIKVVDAKEASKLKGNKTKKSNDDTRGLILHIFDEINEVRNFAYLAVLPNLQSQNFMVITSQNFKSEDDMGGMICEPVGRYEGDVARYKDLDVELDHLWSSAERSMTLRFDGKRAANIQAKRKIYSYLFHQEDWDRLAEKGTESNTFYSQARSFPVRGDAENNKVLSQSKISGSRYTDPWFTVTGDHTRVSFCDPAFGGKDEAKWGFASFGHAIVVDGLGAETVEMIFQVTHHFEKLTLVKDAKYNQFWFDRMRMVGIDTSQVVVDSEVSIEDQLAIQCAEKNQEHGISPDNFGYDFSMREDIGPSMARYIGTSCKPFGYNRKPDGYRLESLNKTTDEHCEDRISELCYLTADLFNSRQFRGGEFCEEGIIQLARTRVEEIGKAKKKKCEDKKSYKHQWKYSPDDRDVLVGLVGMASLKGMVTKSLKSEVKGDSNSKSRVTGKFRIKRAKRI